MSMSTMPMLVLNLGSEMLYILEQRLVAQSILPEKARRVTREVSTAMLSPGFLDELFRPQRPYSAAAARQVFHRLAHASIMRLNTTSYEKLYDLMTMGFKFQLFRSSEPADVVQITLNHLDAVRGIVAHSPEAVRLVDDAADRVVAHYGGMRPYEMLALRRALLGFLQDRRIKVSLFLQNRQQHPNGMIVIDHRGRLPAGGDPPGAVRYFGGDASHPERQSHVVMGNAEGIEPPAGEFDLRVAAERPCKLGHNMYAERERKRQEAAGTLPTVEPPSPREEDGEAHLQASSAVAKAELSVLAGLISLGGAGAGGDDDDDFTVANLFPDTALDGIGDGAVLEADELTIGGGDGERDREARRRAVEARLGGLDLGPAAEGSDGRGAGAGKAAPAAAPTGEGGSSAAAAAADEGDEDDEDDLLALMDQS